MLAVDLRRRLALNMQTCTRCATEKLGPCADGEVCACPVDGQPYFQKAVEGRCEWRKLIGDPVPRKAGKQPPKPPRHVAGGVGSELKKILTALLKEMGLKEPQNCGCWAHVAEMDARGIEWCQANRTTIFGWIRESAVKIGVSDLQDEMLGALLEMAVENAKAAAQPVSGE